MLADVADALKDANLAFAKGHPGESPGRQPVHTVYGGAQIFASDSAPKLGGIAVRAMEQYADDASALGGALGIHDHPELETIYQAIENLEDLIG